MGKGLTEEQKATYNQLQELMPTDLIPGYTVADAGNLDPESAFLKGMKKFSEELGKNAYAYYNFDISKRGIKRTRRVSKKILSAEGFPPWVNVTYAYPAPRSFHSWLNGDRPVKHFIFHSFGHGWMASWSAKSKSWVGWMNSKKNGRGVEAYEFEGRTVYICKGSDPETLAHFQRFSAGLGTALAFTSGVAPNFFIDRAGNLVVIGNCNDIQIASNRLDRFGVSVELEEAFYVEQDTSGSANKAKFDGGGNPRGIGGPNSNIKYFTYSPQQLFTLSIICKKLESVYEPLRERNVVFVDRTATWQNTPPGYAMHDFISQGVDKKTGRPKGHFDISPQFKTQELWDAFFRLVDSHHHIDSNNTFRPPQRYQDMGESYTTKPLAEDTLTAMTERLLQEAKDQGFASERANNLINADKNSQNTSTGTAAAKESLRLSQQVANTTNLAQQTQEIPVSLPDVDNLEEDERGQQVGSDDVW